jgi:NAD(P)-dependent dehydrogenase (short-subunit alcohol dehydrogenase family)
MAQLKDGVVVVTGASSGIGRATAHELAKKGARVVLIARNEEALLATAQEVRDLGGQALALACDVTDEAAVMDAARLALEAFGRIDAWVNCAAVTSFGDFEQTPSEAFRRVIETDLFGTVHGARAALAAFRPLNRGVLVNVGSIAGKVAQPHAAAYSSAKFALRGFTEALRKELLETDIDVCAVLPESTDTPLFQHGANFSRRAVRPMAPIDSAQKVARRIVRVIARPRREVTIGPTGYLGQVLQLFGRGLGEWAFKKQVGRRHFQPQPAHDSAGNLFRPGEDATSGGWLAPKGRNGALGVAAGLGLALAPLALRWYRESQTPRRGLFAR